ncbi:MAG: TM2 domain-containing protein [Clostridia bacterium]|nr:TM2 domain-containing protein [Clostridia bacterium]
MLNKQYGFNYKADEYTCKVCHTLLYHYYTDEPYTVKHTREKATHENSSYAPHKKPSHDAPTSHRNAAKLSKTNDWLLFFLCLFFGYLGIHKFAENKIGMGILYIFTFGLFCIGWFIDVANYFNRATN